MELNTDIVEKAILGIIMQKKDWQWIEIVKPPKVKTIPDILTPSELNV